MTEKAPSFRVIMATGFITGLIPVGIGIIVCTATFFGAWVLSLVLKTTGISAAIVAFSVKYSAQINYIVIVATGTMTVVLLLLSIYYVGLVELKRRSLKAKLDKVIVKAEAIVSDLEAKYGDSDAK